MKLDKTEQQLNEGFQKSESDGMLWDQIESHCLSLGWSLGKLASEAGISRTTLHQWKQRGRYYPQHRTVHKLASAFGLTPHELKHGTVRSIEKEHPQVGPYDDQKGRQSFPLEDLEETRQFNRETNWMIEEVCRDQPELFAEWGTEDWDELFSTFGVGGELNRDGVVQQVTKMNERRDTLYQLHVLLETHLGETARQVIQSLYDAVQCEGIAIESVSEITENDLLSEKKQSDVR